MRTGSDLNGLRPQSDYNLVVFNHYRHVALARTTPNIYVRLRSYSAKEQDVAEASCLTHGSTLLVPATRSSRTHLLGRRLHSTLV